MPGPRAPLHGVEPGELLLGRQLGTIGDVVGGADEAVEAITCARAVLASRSEAVGEILGMWWRFGATAMLAALLMPPLWPDMPAFPARRPPEQPAGSAPSTGSPARRTVSGWSGTVHQGSRARQVMAARSANISRMAAMAGGAGSNAQGQRWAPEGSTVEAGRPSGVAIHPRILHEARPGLGEASHIRQVASGAPSTTSVSAPPHGSGEASASPSCRTWRTAPWPPPPHEPCGRRG